MSFAQSQRASQVGADASDRRRFLVMTPNIVDDLPLSPFAFRLYVHVRRVAGERGACWQSSRTLAARCRMSVGAVVKAKRELARPFAELGGLPLITITPQPNGNHLIRVTDIWQQNLAAFDKSAPPSDRSPDERAVQRVSATVRHMNAPRSPSEPKKYPSEEETPEEGMREARVPARPPSTALPADFVVTPEMRAWATEHLTFVDVDLEHEQFLESCREKGIRSEDWSATWRKFMRRALQFQPHRPPTRSAADERDRRLRERDYESTSHEAAAEILAGAGRRF
jgi:Helix-turn-helix domain